MLRWDSYRTVYGAELRAAAREYSDHGWTVVGGGPAGLLLATGSSLDVLEMPAAVGRLVCAQLRAAGVSVPVAATPTGRWWYPVTTGGTLPDSLREGPDVVLHTGGAAFSPRRRRRPTAGSTGGSPPRSPATVRHRFVRSSTAVLAAADSARARPPPRSGRRCVLVAWPGAVPAAADRRSAPGTTGKHSNEPSHRTSAEPRFRRHVEKSSPVRRPRGHFSLAALPHPPSRPGPVVRGHRPRPEPAPARGDRHYGFVQTHDPPRPARTPPARPPGQRRVAVEVGLGVGGPTDKARDLRRMKRFATGLAARRRGDLPGRPLVGGQRRARLGRLRPGDGRGRDGRCAGRLVRRHRALPAPAGAADPAHGDHPDARRTCSATASATSSARTSSPRTWCATSSPASRSPRGSGEWIGQEANADRVTAELATAARGVVTVLRDDDVQEVIEQVLVRKLMERPLGPPLGAVLQGVLADGAHHRLVDLVCDRAYDWVTEQPGDGAADRPRAGAGLDAAVPRRHRRRQGVRRGAELRVGGEDRPGAPAAQGHRHVPRRVRRRPAAATPRRSSASSGSSTRSSSTPTCRSSSARRGSTVKKLCSTPRRRRRAKPRSASRLHAFQLLRSLSEQAPTMASLRRIPVFLAHALNRRMSS